MTHPPGGMPSPTVRGGNVRPMCSAITCRVCGKTTWTGCGSHVDAVRATVRPENWCGGHAATAEQPAKRGWFRR